MTTEKEIQRYIESRKHLLQGLTPEQAYEKMQVDKDYEKLVINEFLGLIHMMAPELTGKELISRLSKAGTQEVMPV